jgi:hypothetical protein
MNGREDAIRRNATKNVPVSRPSPSGAPTAPPGERGGQGTVGANEVQWKSTPQSREEYYAPGGQGQTNLNISNPAYPNYVGPPVNTGGDGGVGTDTGTGSGSSGSKPPGMYTTHLVDLFNEITGGNVLEGGIGNLRELSRDTLGGSDPNTINNLENLDTVNPSENWNDKFQLLGGNDSTGLQYNLTDPGKLGYNINENMGFTADVNPFKGTGNLGFNMSFADGGPVGLMSLPQGYANGGEVIEGEDTMEELAPFGGTRERVMDQVEAFDNAPHHIEEPMIGMYGEKVPLSIARRVQGYMEGLDPVKRNLIQEMMQMFHMKKMQEQQQDLQDKGHYFGPQPKEYDI